MSIKRFLASYKICFCQHFYTQIKLTTDTFKS